MPTLSQTFFCHHFQMKLVAVARIELVLQLMKLSCTITLPRNKDHLLYDYKYNGNSKNVKQILKLILNI